MSARRDFLVREEAKRLKETLAACDFGERGQAITAVARRILLDGAFSYDGLWHFPKVKSVGAGVYDVWLEVGK